MKSLAYALMIVSIFGLNSCSRTVYYKHMSMVDNPMDRCIIEYNEDDRRLHIYGKKDSDNLAMVDFIDESPASLFPTKISVLCRWGVVPEGVEDIPAQEVRAVFITAWLTTAPADAQSQPRRIHEIIFHGSSQKDTFINNTNISSLAFGREGNDTFIGGQAEDWLYGDENDDTLKGRRGKDDLYGGPGNDMLYGGKGGDDLYGHSGSDKLYGGPGGDTLTVTWQHNAMDFNLLCGGDGGDYLSSPGNNAGDELHSEKLDGNDGHMDTLEIGTQLTQPSNVEFQYTQIHDKIVADGEEVELGDLPSPSDDINCVVPPGN